MEDKKYLTPDFDPSTLKVAQLRRILVEHDIKFTASAKKQTLLNLFGEKIKPKASTLLAKYNEANVPNGNDILDASSKKSIIGNSSDDEPEPASKNQKKTKKVTKPKKKTKSKRQSSTVPQKEEQLDSPHLKAKALDVTDDSIKLTPPEDKLDRKIPRKHREKVAEEVKSPELDLKLKPALDHDLEEELLDEKCNQIIPSKDEDEKIKLERVKENIETTFSTRNVFQKEHSSIPHKRSRDLEEYSSPNRKQIKQDKSSKDIFKGEDSFNSTEDIDFDKLLSSPTKGKVTRTKDTPKSVTITPQVSRRHRKTSRSTKQLSNTPTTHSDHSFSSSTPIEEHVPSGPTEKIDLKKEKEDFTKSSRKTPKVTKRLKQESVEADKNNDSTLLETLKNEVEEEENQIKKDADELLVNIENASSNVSFKTVLKYFLTWFFASLVFVAFLLWREQRIYSGYCGSSIHKKVFDIDYDIIPEQLLPLMEYVEETSSQLVPECIPCPEHAECFSLFKARCDVDFVSTHPWYSIFGFVPTPVTCVPDQRKTENIHRVTNYLLFLLRNRNAEIDCGRGLDEDAGLSLEELHDLVLEIKPDYVSPEEFEYYWSKALVDLESEPEIILSTSNDINREQDIEGTYQEIDKSSNQTIIRSTSLTNLSFQCQIDRYITSILIKYRPFALAFIGLLIFIRASIFIYRRNANYKERITGLVSEVFQRLQRRAGSAKKDSSGLTRPYIGSHQLRDLLLDSEMRFSEKNKIWKDVSKKVERNSNIRSRVIEVFGEVMKVWEWISDVDN
ncbi:hypothetical protein LJB42_001724 [Komagataella kurtzmanii]|nr:hypothetical protein LJB42_001724 [Komagataella kurtzmanii]